VGVLLSHLASVAATHAPAVPHLFELTIDKKPPFDFFTVNGLIWIDWASICGLIITVVGFGITWWQLYRTRTAREAASDTRREINQTTAIKRLNKSLPSFRTIYRQATEAAYQKDKRELRLMLENWLSKCGPAIAQLEQLQERRVSRRWASKEDDRAARVVEKLQSAQGRVAEALRKMDYQPDMTDLESGVQYALTAMREFSDLAARMREEDNFFREAAS
jgi:hypothetical protein